MWYSTLSAPEEKKKGPKQGGGRRKREERRQATGATVRNRCRCRKKKVGLLQQNSVPSLEKHSL